jgi:Ca-activated chloride channel family protein
MTLAAQEQPFRSGANTVAIYATVTDAGGRLVTDLTRDDFEVYDEGRRQAITIFASEKQPLSIVMLLDRSGSMQTNFRFVEAAATEFVELISPADRMRIGSFAARIQIDPAQFTEDREALIGILRNELQPAGPTPLWNAVNVGVTALMRQDGRRVILVFTDGIDSPMGGRSVGQKEATRNAQAQNVMVYAIGLATELRARRRGAPGAPAAPTVRRPDPGLPKIAAETGGGYFELTRTSDLSATFAKVIDELHRQYAIGFAPPKLDGKTHDLEVRIKKPGLTVRARQNYVAK